MQEDRYALFISTSRLTQAIQDAAQAISLPIKVKFQPNSQLISSLSTDKSIGVVITDSNTLDKIGAKFFKELAQQKPVLVIGNLPSQNFSPKHKICANGQQLCRHANMFFCPSISRILGLASAFLNINLPQDPGVTIITNSGGAGVLAADACAEGNLYLSRPDQQMLQHLQVLLSRHVPLYNPIEIPEHSDCNTWKKVLETSIIGQQTKNLLLIFAPTPQIMTCMSDFIWQLIEIVRKSHVPIHICLLGNTSWKQEISILQKESICYQYTPEECLQNIWAMFTFYNKRQLTSD